MSVINQGFQYIFVYGTLRKGFYNHRGRLDGTAGHSKFIKEDTVDGVMYDLGAFPAAVLYEPSVSDSLNERMTIHGEVYEIDNNVLKKLDVLEGYPKFYNRSKITTHSGIEVWIYHIDKKSVENKPIVKNGIWR
jgi:gamma-glutamylcyclotransferase (GGCT)/AIG2-like uncharacterized protein YtfP